MCHEVNCKYKGCLFQYFRLKLVHDLVVLFTRSLFQRGDQFAQTRSQDDEIARGSMEFGIVMRNAGGHEDGCPWRRIHLSVAELEGQCPFQNMPRFIVGIMNVEITRTASTPFVNVK